MDQARGSRPLFPAGNIYPPYPSRPLSKGGAKRHRKVLLVYALALACAVSPADAFRAPAVPAIGATKAVRGVGTELQMRHGHNDDRNTEGEDIGWGGVTGDDWFMTARMRYLREMERLGQEFYELSQAYNNGMAGNVVEPEPPVLPGASAANDAAMQEELRRLEVAVAERCAENWKRPPLSSKAVGFVPGGRKVQQIKLFHKRVMYGSDSGYVGLANTVDGKKVFGEQVHSALVTALDYDSETGWLISAADDGMVVVYKETEEGVKPHLRLRPHSNRIVAAEILDHHLGMTASVDGRILIFELQTGALVNEMITSDTLLSASVCRGYVFAGLISGAVEAFSIRSGRSAFRYISQRCPIRSLKAFPTANSVKIVTGGQDGIVRQFHVRPVLSSEVWKVPGSEKPVDDRLVLMCNTHVEQDKERGGVEQGFVLRGHQGPVVAVACDEHKVVSASEDGTVTVWDALKGTASYSVRQHVDGDMVSCVDFSERYLVADGSKGSVFVWDFAVGPAVRRASPGAAGKRSRGALGGKRPGRAGGPSSRQGRGGLTPPPGGLPGLPFIGGWNLGHGPTDFGGEALPGMGMPGGGEERRDEGPEDSPTDEGSGNGGDAN